jgi:hypothetical protein
MARLTTEQFLKKFSNLQNDALIAVAKHLIAESFYSIPVYTGALRRAVGEARIKRGKTGQIQYRIKSPKSDRGYPYASIQYGKSLRGKKTLLRHPKDSRGRYIPMTSLVKVSGSGLTKKRYQRAYRIARKNNLLSEPEAAEWFKVIDDKNVQKRLTKVYIDFIKNKLR